MSVVAGKVFVTGSTGFIGERLVRRLRSENLRVVAFVRSIEKASMLFDDPGVEFREGSLEDVNSIVSAMDGCDKVYHLAGYARQWHKDPTVFHKVNVDGFRNILDAALHHGISRVVFTSTAGAIGPSGDGPVSEETRRSVPPTTAYERSKELAEGIIPVYLEKGLEIVTVNPTRVFGPGQLNESNTVTMLIRDYVRGKWRYLPGNGKSIGNYVYVEDVVEGHILAMARGESGQRYILGGANLSYIELFGVMSDVTGARHKLYKVPLPLMMAIARVEKMRAELTGKPPLITPGFVKKYTYNWETDHSRATAELGYQPTDIHEAIELTTQWLRSSTNLSGRAERRHVHD